MALFPAITLHCPLPPAPLSLRQSLPQYSLLSVPLPLPIQPKGVGLPEGGGLDSGPLGATPLSVSPTSSIPLWIDGILTKKAGIENDWDLRFQKAIELAQARRKAIDFPLAREAWSA